MSNSNKEKKNGFRCASLNVLPSNNDCDVDEDNDIPIPMPISIPKKTTDVNSNLNIQKITGYNDKNFPILLNHNNQNCNNTNQNCNSANQNRNSPNQNCNNNNQNCNNNNQNCNNNNQNCKDKLQVFNSNFSYGVAVTLLKSPEEGVEKLVDILEHLIETGRIDCFYSNKYMIEGRIYEVNDDAEFRCQIYRLEKDSNKAILEFSRTGGDSCAFLEFRKTVCNQLKECIANDCNDTSSGSETCDIDNDFDISSQQSFFSMESITDIDFGIQELSISGDNNNINNSNNNNDDENNITYYEGAIRNVKNRDCCREIYRDHIITLQYIIADTKKAEILSQLNNIFEDLLSPMEDGPNTLLDCWIIKTLLEIVCKLLPLNKAKCPTDKIKAIKKKWENKVNHPLGIVSFFPSQQICRLCDSCISVLEKKL